MKDRFAFSESVTNAISKPLPGGRVWGILLRLDGTNSSSYDPADLGVIRVTRDGGTLIDIDFEDLLNLSNQLFGYAGRISGTTFSAQAVIPFFLAKGAPDNALYVKDGELYLYIPGTGTTTATMYAEVLIGDIPERYEMHIASMTENMTGNLSIKLPGENIMAVGLYEASGATDPTRVQIDIDGEKYVDSAWNALVDKSNLFNRIETPLTDKAFINLMPSGEINEALSDDVRLQVIGGSGNMNIVTVYAKFKSEKITLSQVSLSQDIQRKAIKLPANIRPKPIPVPGGGIRYGKVD